PPTAHRFSPSPSPSQHPYLSSTPPSSTPHASTPQPPATTTTTPVLPLSSTPQPQPTPQTLTPFFTLISNPSSTIHKHPAVHYVFSDDDFDPISPSASGKEREQERVVVVDMNADGESVAAAHSFSSDWQVTGVNVASAPQWMAGDEDGGGGGASGSGGGLMLTIRGLEAPKVGSVGAAVTASGATGGGKESLYELAEMYHERMAEIKSVIEYAERSASAGASAEPE
ncbi:unnamed protein product, partial [Tuber aestivum]